MNATPQSSPPRLVRPEASVRRRHITAAFTVAIITLLAVAGFWSTPIALLAAGAGAGYSLSGSV